MLAALLVCAAAVVAAAAPGVALGAGDLTAARDRAAAAGLETRTTVLAHDLADERDDVAALVAAGAKAPKLPAADGARTDRQLADVLAAGPPAALRTVLAALPGARRAALAARADHDGVQAAVTAYQPLIDALGRAGDAPGAGPLTRLAGAASVQRGLLVGALTQGGTQSALVAAARTAALQERAALADFRATAPADLRDRYDKAVTGADVAKADQDTAELLDGPELTRTDRQLGAAAVKSALTARIGLLRGVEVSAAADRAATAAHHRDHTVTILELRCALAALCLLLLAGVLVALFRSLTRPLAALHRWSRSDAESGRGVEVIGQDEYAAVARRANALTQEAQALRARAADLGNELTAQRGASQGARGALAGAVAEKDALRRAHDELIAHVTELDRELSAAAARNAAHMTHVSLSLRTLGLVERQLALIETMEDQEQDPDRLATLFQLDHLATRMRRNSENLLVLGGTEHSHGATARPVPLIDVVRGAISEVERYERVRIEMLPGVRVAGRASDDVAHLLAELLDNATGFSAPTTEVLLSGQLLETGEVVVAVVDSGIGVPGERLDELNALLADPDPVPPGAVAGMGLYVASRLARRHGVRVRLHPLASGGTQAVVVLPGLLVPPVAPDEPPVTPLDPAAFTGGDPRRYAAAPPVRLPAQASSPDAVHGFAPPSDSPSDLPADLPAAPAPAQPFVPAPAPLRPTPTPAAALAPSPENGSAAPISRSAGGPTGQGLPQRVRGAVGTRRAAPPTPAPRVDAAELRRRLDGLQRGLHAGRAEAARERDEAPAGSREQADPAGNVEEATR
ncbi:sensor histidine kinase [Actinacidiphila paucisporea]|uniref:histidine kinase n=1 Tax=Actinacidiphila paucisporea TaxID=310782 RepID=A0A1M6V941_9ACTN|nr:nitrate- and nitrite sensing domain-containing protein [Actinacidiphila paucisporea]SHK77836.1 Histidine kinase-, DNA gyrase B-, and HSP90-like ATPase [Actinacidiphila paucisporea]